MDRIRLDLSELKVDTFGPTPMNPFDPETGDALFMQKVDTKDCTKGYPEPDCVLSTAC